MTRVNASILIQPIETEGLVIVDESTGSEWYFDLETAARIAKAIDHLLKEVEAGR